MKKQILNLGKALNKKEQQKINGGYNQICRQKGRLCCQKYGTTEFCDAGICRGSWCMWY